MYAHAGVSIYTSAIVNRYGRTDRTSYTTQLAKTYVWAYLYQDIHDCMRNGAGHSDWTHALTHVHTYVHTRQYTCTRARMVVIRCSHAFASEATRQGIMHVIRV